VGRELTIALEIQKQRGRDKFPVVPLAVDDTRLGVLEQFFDGQPLYVPVSSRAGGVVEALTAIFAALGTELPAYRAPAPPAAQRPLDDLILELSHPDFNTAGGKRRARAEAKLVYRPADPQRRRVESDPFVVTAPLGAIELNELRWYLEEYAVWPGGYVDQRARKVEQDLAAWGEALYQHAVPSGSPRDVLAGWSKPDGQPARRFSVQVDGRLPAGTDPAQCNLAREAATALLALPWELLRDGGRFLFQGNGAVRVRRRLPNTRDLEVAVVRPPIRVLLVTARPEDEACRYLDHRASAEPLVRAMENLPGLVELDLLQTAHLPSPGRPAAGAPTRRPAVPRGPL